MTLLTNWLTRLFKPKPKQHHFTAVRTSAGEIYVFTWSDGQQPELFLQLGKYAASPDHPGFDWIDAAAVAESVEGNAWTMEK